MAQIDRDLLAAAGAQFPEIGGGEAGRGERRGARRPDAERRRQDRVGAAGDLDRARPLLGPAGDGKIVRNASCAMVEISPICGPALA